MWEEIRAAHVAGKIRMRKRDHLIRRFVTSYDVRLSATRLALKKLKPHCRPDKKRLASIASGLNAWQGAQEPVRTSLIPKPNSDDDDYRPIMDFGVKHRALQYILLDVLRAVADLHPRQYGNRGGVHAAIKQVAKLMAKGYLWAVEIDLEKCFQSFDADKVPDYVPLPKKVTERNLLSRSLNLVPGNLYALFGPASDELVSEVLAAARWGIPPGSAASSIVAEMLLAPVLHQLGLMGEFVAYADNILIMGKSEEDAASMTLALRGALKAHPAGPLRPKLPKCCKAGSPILFLGHRLTPTKMSINIEPSPENRAEFQYQLKRGVAYIRRHSIPLSDRLRRAHHLAIKVRSWAAAFSLCPEVKVLRKYWLTQIKAAVVQAKTSAKSEAASLPKSPLEPVEAEVTVGPEEATIDLPADTPPHAQAKLARLTVLKGTKLVIGPNGEVHCHTPS
jgi:hypothetical protein